MKTIILIPAKDEEAKIGEVVGAVKKFYKDAVVIDDGSSDRTAEKAKAAGAKVLRHLVNRGQGASIRTGTAFARQAGYEAVVFFDADGQMLPEEISRLTAELDNGYDVALGSRFMGKTENMPFYKLLTLKLALWFTRLTTGLKLSDTHNGFQAWRLSALDKIDFTQDRQAYASQLLKEIAAKKLKYKELPVTIKYTDYSKRKGQSIFNAINILWDLIIRK